MYDKKTEARIFKEAINGYGFVEVEQTPDGIYCDGCLTTHKRPTKMYTNGSWTLCKFQVVNMFNPNHPDDFEATEMPPNENPNVYEPGIGEVSGPGI